MQIMEIYLAMRLFVCTICFIYKLKEYNQFKTQTSNIYQKLQATYNIYNVIF